MRLANAERRALASLLSWPAGGGVRLGRNPTDPVTATTTGDGALRARDEMRPSRGRRRAGSARPERTGARGAERILCAHPHQL